MEQKNQVVLFGASGLVGSHVLSLLSDDRRVERIFVIARRPLPLPQKADLNLCDLKSPKQLAALLKKSKSNVAICCLGTTMAKAGSKQAFYAVDHDLIVGAAQACKAAGVDTFGVISSAGANIKSLFFYPRVKAETERDLMKLNFKRLVILRPAVLLGERVESRPLERLFIKAAPIFSPLFVGYLKRYQPVAAKSVAACLIEESIKNEPGSVIVDNESIA